jgi:hypothetical protein
MRRTNNLLVASAGCLHGPADRCRSLVPAEPRTDHDDEVAALDLAEFDSIVQGHRDAGRAGVTPFLHDGMAFLDRHITALRRYRDRPFADLGEDQLVHLIRGEAVFGGLALEQARPILFID